MRRLQRPSGLSMVCAFASFPIAILRPKLRQWRSNIACACHCKSDTFLLYLTGGNCGPKSRGAPLRFAGCESALWALETAEICDLPHLRSRGFGRKISEFGGEFGNSPNFSVLKNRRILPFLGPFGAVLNSRVLNGRGERIRTSGPCLPKTVLYQAELLPDSEIGCDPDEGRRAP